ncbi:MAG: hypothetical protein MMC33_002614 [Icmadophila ericetorum]|nr:hypothetical protein [Icmadophila ericetorum]
MATEEITTLPPEEPEAQPGSQMIPKAEKPTHCFQTYLEYLDKIKEKWPEYDTLREYLRKGQVWVTWHFICICDVQVDGSIVEQQLSWIDHEKAQKFLSTVASNVRTRFLIIDYTEELSPWAIDLLGLTLDIEPSFFSRIIDQDLKYLPQAKEYLQVQDSYIKNLSKRPNSIDEAINFLYDHNTQITQPAKKRLDFVATQLGSILRQHPSECTSTEIDLLEGFIGVSQLLLSQLQLSSNEMRPLYVAWLDSNAIGHQEANDKRVERNLCELRRELEEHKRSLRATSRFAQINFGEQLVKESKRFEQLRIDQEEAQIEASALEAEIRESLLLQVGLLSLEEYGRSIEESKRVRILTILASIFIPVNLATSVFGMNVQEINGSGKNIWVFAVTAVALTTLALLG